MSESANERRLDPLVGFHSVFSTPPDFVNAEGVKWWRDKDTERYATNEDQHGTRLRVEVWVVERPDGYRTRLLIEAGQIIGEAQSLEAIGAKIDWLKCATRFDERKPNAGGEGRERSERTSPPPCSASPVAQPPRDVSELYHELLYAVARKFPGESRHETALRYIRDTEDRVCQPGSCKQNDRLQRPGAAGGNDGQ